MNIEDYNILDILPQKLTSVYVDKVISYSNEDNTITCEKTVQEDEYLLQGHFPQNPIVPSIFTIEALSQACILCGFFYTKNIKAFEVENSNYNHYTIKLDLKFKNIVQPNETLVLNASLVEVIDVVSIFKVKAINKITNKIIAVGQITGVIKKREAENIRVGINTKKV